MKLKNIGIVYLIAGLYYMIAETICIFSVNDTLFNMYIFHTISDLGIPNGNCPFFFLMDSAFILIGLALVFANFYKFKDFIIKYKPFFYIFTVIASIGVIMVGFIPWGNPLTNGYHNLGAIMAIFGGNLMLLTVSRSMDKFEIYQKITLILGVIGLIAFLIMFFNMESIYMPVFERLAVYPLIIWHLMTGVYLLMKNQ